MVASDHFAGTQGVCAGLGSVVGFGVGTVGEVERVGAGATVWTEGPAFVVSFTPLAASLGTNAQSSSNATTAAAMMGRRTPMPESRGPRGFLYVMRCFRSRRDQACPVAVAPRYEERPRIVPCGAERGVMLLPW